MFYLSYIEHPTFTNKDKEVQHKVLTTKRALIILYSHWENKESF